MPSCRIAHPSARYGSKHESWRELGAARSCDQASPSARSRMLRRPALRRSQSGAARLAVSLEAPSSFGAHRSAARCSTCYFAPRGSAIGWLDPGAFAPLTSQRCRCSAAQVWRAPTNDQHVASNPPQQRRRRLSRHFRRLRRDRPVRRPTRRRPRWRRRSHASSSASRANPLGAGDWRAARAAIGAFYAGRGFQPVWVDARRPDRGRPPGARADSPAPPRTASICRASRLPRDLGGRLDPHDARRSGSRDRRAVVAYAEQASGSRIAPSRVSPLFDDCAERRRSRRGARRDGGRGRSRRAARRLQSAAEGLSRAPRGAEAPRVRAGAPPPRRST